MIDFTLTEEEELIQTTAREFVRDRLRENHRLFESQGKVSQAVMEEYHRMGFPSLEIPAAYGGQGLSPFTKVLVLEELGWGDAGSALALDGIGPALYPLIEMGTPEEIAPRITPFIAPEGAGRRAILALDHDQRCRERDGQISGKFHWVPADGAALVVILTAGAAYVITPDTRIDPVQPCGLHAAGAGEMTLVKAPVDLTLRSEEGYRRALARVRTYAAALLVGVGRAALEYAIQYSQDRVAFGKAIAHHQGVAFIIADMATAVDAARLAVWRAAHAVATATDPLVEACAAHSEAADQALFVTNYAVQLLGGHGFIKDHPVEKWMRDARTLALLWGGRDATLHDSAEEIFREMP